MARKQRPPAINHMENLKKLCPKLREEGEVPPNDSIVRLNESANEIKKREIPELPQLSLSCIKEVSETIHEVEDNFLRQLIEKIDTEQYRPQPSSPEELSRLDKAIGTVCTR